MTTDGAGGATRTWVAAGAAFASVEPIARREAVDAQRAVALVTHRVTVRFRDDVGRHVRFLDGATRYRVLATEPDAQRRFLACLCSEEQG